MAASFNCCVVTLLVWSRRRTSLAASWTVGSKVVTQCWMSVLVQLSGMSSFRDGCGGCRTSARTGGLCAGWDGSPGEGIAQVVELLFGAGKLVCGVLECPQGSAFRWCR